MYPVTESQGVERREDFGGPRSILLIEDDSDLREVLALALERVGYVVRSARNGWEALQLLYRGPKPALIIMDLHMPVMTGWRFLQHKQAEPDLADVPVLVLSAAANKPTGVARGLENMEVVSKPFDFLELLAKIRPFVGPIDLRSDLLN